jgi:hypothetical protein
VFSIVSFRILRQTLSIGCPKPSALLVYLRRVSSAILSGVISEFCCFTSIVLKAVRASIGPPTLSALWYIFTDSACPALTTLLNHIYNLTVITLAVNRLSLRRFYWLMVGIVVILVGGTVRPA